jgi:murein endopeptidase
MAKEIRTRQVCKDIKALDKAKAATGHMKHAYVRIRERAGNAQMQGQESETPADYAESKVPVRLIVAGKIHL